MIVVTGASGLLGANLALAACERGYETVGLYHRHPVRLAGVRCLSIDLSDRLAVMNLLQSLHPRWIVHCAALTNVDWCEDHSEEAFRDNAHAPGEMASLARELDARFVYISTDAVFDGQFGGYSEDDTPRPINVYAQSKLAGEQAVAQAHPDSLIVRTNLFGWNVQDKASLGEWVLTRLKAGSPVPAFDDVEFAPLLANDLGEIVLDLLHRGARGLFHAGASDAVSKYDFALAIAREFGLSTSSIQRTHIADAALRAPRPQKTWLRADKLEQALDRRMPTVAQAIARFHELQTNGFVKKLKQMAGNATNAAH